MEEKNHHSIPLKPALQKVIKTLYQKKRHKDAELHLDFSRGKCVTAQKEDRCRRRN
jgi:hypothetical protein